jgi:predicted nucleic acid-binding protein
VTPQIHELAAENANRCLKRGVTTSAIDILICTVAAVEGMAVFSTDPDIERISRVLAIKLHKPRDSHAS